MSLVLVVIVILSEMSFRESDDSCGYLTGSSFYHVPGSTSLYLFFHMLIYFFSYVYFYILQTSSENYKLLFIIDILSVVKFILVS